MNRKTQNPRFSIPHFKLIQLGFIIFIVSLIILSGHSQCVADEDDGDVFYSLGLKMWHNAWLSSGDIGNKSKKVISFTSDSVTAIMPSLSVIYKKYFLSLGVMPDTAYQFEEFTDIKRIGGVYTAVTEKWTADRSEVDLNTGYLVRPNFGFSLGLKYIRQKYDIEYIDASNVLSSDTDLVEYGFPIVGIIGHFPINDKGYGFYGNSGLGHNSKASYVSAELGFSYRPFDGISFIFGYKYQAIDDSHSGNEFIWPDVTKGFIFGGTYLF